MRERSLGVLRKSEEPQVTMPCKVLSSTFKGERVVVYNDADENQVVGLADHTEVITEKDPGPGEELEGRVVVHCVKEEGDRVLVDVPQQVFTGHRRMFVPKDVLRIEE